MAMPMTRPSARKVATDESGKSVVALLIQMPFPARVQPLEIAETVGTTVLNRDSLLAKLPNLIFDPGPQLEFFKRSAQKNPISRLDKDYVLSLLPGKLPPVVLPGEASLQEGQMDWAFYFEGLGARPAQGSLQTQLSKVPQRPVNESPRSLLPCPT